MGFRVGQKVVCVDVSSPTVRGSRVFLCLLAKGDIYTVIDSGADPSTGIPYVQLAEFSGPDAHGFPHWWKASRFRPLTERSTDAGMSILRKILTDAEKEMV